MANKDTRAKLIHTTKQLLLDGVPLQTLTARKISTEAGTNLAMINYCFKSKDELLNIAIQEIVSEEFHHYSKTSKVPQTPKVQLRELLLHICNTTIKFQELTRASIPYLLLQEELTLPLQLLPFLKQHFGARRTDSECRVIAFQLVSTMQLIFYRADDFRSFSGIDITDSKQLADFIDFQLNIFLENDTNKKEEL